jgi:DNA-binding HxlR family transcriptional regulator
VLPRTYDEQICSVARALEVVGERWTMLVIRDAFRGKTRFAQFERSVGAPKKVLADRLERLVEEGVLERRLYQERPERYEYVLTKKGHSLWRVIAQLMFWGDEHYRAEGGRPRILKHIGCGGQADARFHCKKCGAELEREDVELVAGPGLKAARAAAQAAA